MLVHIQLERYTTKKFKKLQAKACGSFKIIKKFESNACYLDLPAYVN